MRLTCIKASLPVFHFLSTTRHTIETLLFTAFKVKVTIKFISKMPVK